jgi:DNA processing protein
VKNQKPTIAVVASGLLNITPAFHRQLAVDIIKNGGTLISEYAIGVPSLKYRYLERNRLISGMSEATVVIEAKIRSGALITAHHALEQNRTIYALPGDITRPQAQGCLQLIADGATPIISIHKTLEDLGFQAESIQMRNFSILEKSIFYQLAKKPCSSEELIELINIPLPKLNGLLSSMEIQGLIHRNHAMQWEAG